MRSFCIGETKEQNMHANSIMRTTRPKRRRIVFLYRGQPGSKVYLAGDFNAWSPNTKLLNDKRGDGNYRITVSLEPGVYEYKFVVDGIWCVDPQCAEWTQNAVGSLNSVLRVMPAR